MRCSYGTVKISDVPSSEAPPTSNSISYTDSSTSIFAKHASSSSRHVNSRVVQTTVVASAEVSEETKAKDENVVDEEEDECVICLDEKTDKTIVLPCMHQYCFECIQKWIQINPECPLCKQLIMSIIHAIKSDGQFTEEKIENLRPRLEFPNFAPFAPAMRDRGMEQRNYWNENVLPVRRLFGDGARIPIAVLRSFLYSINLTTRFRHPLERIASVEPDFFASNIVCLNRLMVFIVRDITTLFHSADERENLMRTIKDLLTQLRLDSAAARELLANTSLHRFFDIWQRETLAFARYTSTMSDFDHSIDYYSSNGTLVYRGDTGVVGNTFCTVIEAALANSSSRRQSFYIRRYLSTGEALLDNQSYHHVSSVLLDHARQSNPPSSSFLRLDRSNILSYTFGVVEPSAPPPPSSTATTRGDHTYPLSMMHDPWNLFQAIPRTTQRGSYNLLGNLQTVENILQANPTSPTDNFNFNLISSRFNEPSENDWRFLNLEPRPTLHRSETTTTDIPMPSSTVPFSSPSLSLYSPRPDTPRPSTHSNSSDTSSIIVSRATSPVFFRHTSSPRASTISSASTDNNDCIIVNQTKNNPIPIVIDSSPERSPTPVYSARRLALSRKRLSLLQDRFTENRIRRMQEEQEDNKLPLKKRRIRHRRSNVLPTSPRFSSDSDNEAACSSKRMRSVIGKVIGKPLSIPLDYWTDDNSKQEEDSYHSSSSHTEVPSSSRINDSIQEVLDCIQYPSNSQSFSDLLSSPLVYTTDSDSGDKNEVPYSRQKRRKRHSHHKRSHRSRKELFDYDLLCLDMNDTPTKQKKTPAGSLEQPILISDSEPIYGPNESSDDSVTPQLLNIYQPRSADDFYRYLEGTVVPSDETEIDQRSKDLPSTENS